MEDLKHPLTPIHSGRGSSMTSWNGTCPESPDGQRVAYFVQERAASEEGETVAGAVWSCSREFTDHRKIRDVVMTTPGFQHNGAMTIWIDNHRLAFRENEGGVETIHVIDIDTGESVVPPVVGLIGHYAVDHYLPFSIRPDDEVRNPDFPGIDEAGIYMLNCDNGVITRIVSTRSIIAFLEAEGLSADEKTPNISHVMLNPSRTRVMARIDAVECQTIVSTDLDGGEPMLFRDKPLHQLWYDDETYYAVDRSGTGNIHRWQQDGTLVDTLAGKGNHIDMSPDKQWLVTDSMYRTSPVFVDLFRRGETTACARLDEHTMTHPVWKLGAHANPVFSRDGKRVYFVQAVAENQVRAVCVDIEGISD